MEYFQYDAHVSSSDNLGSCTISEHDYNGEIGIFGTPNLSSFDVSTTNNKILKTSSSWNLSVLDASLSKRVMDNKNVVNEANENRGCNNKKTRSIDSKSKSNLQYHVIAERQRREILSQKLIALSALIPCLKKMSKGKVIEEAVKYVQHLQERVKNLEAKAKQQNVESPAVLVKTTHVVMDETDEDDTNSSSSSSSNKEGVDLLYSKKNDALIPEMEARFSNKDVLISVYCENKHGLVGCLLSEMKKFHLAINSSNFFPFENYMVITISAQMNESFSVTPKELVTKLRRVF